MAEIERTVRAVALTGACAHGPRHLDGRLVVDKSGASSSTSLTEGQL